MGLFTNLGKRTKVLLWVLLGLVVIAAGVLTYGQLTGKFKTFADMNLPYGNGEISGTVTDSNGMPLAGLLVTINGKEISSIDTTTASGHYSFKGLSNEVYTVEVYSGEGSCNGASGSFTPTNTQANLKLGPFFTGKQSGYVQDTDTLEPIAGAVVSFEAISSQRTGSTLADAITDEHGNYDTNYAVIRAGDANVTVSAFNYETLVSRVNLPICADKTFNFSLKKASGSLEGNVTVNGGIPKGTNFAGAGVSIRALPDIIGESASGKIIEKREWSGASIVNQKDGKYKVTGVPVGRYEVKICFGGGGSCVASILTEVDIIKGANYLDLPFKFGVQDLKISE